tara:strand:- start:323 stop:571 length:249 start_codon:yes stop_codon:yes gene_type:complete
MTEIEQKIVTILEEDINPALAQHEGSASFKSLLETDDLWIVNINFQGACSGCEGARGGTLVSIQNFLKEELGIPNLIVVPHG